MPASRRSEQGERGGVQARLFVGGLIQRYRWKMSFFGDADDTNRRISRGEHGIAYILNMCCGNQANLAVPEAAVPN